MSRPVILVSTLAIVGLLAGCGSSSARAAGAPDGSGSPAPAGVAGGDAARALSTQRVLNGLRARGHHNVRRPRHLSNG